MASGPGFRGAVQALVPTWLGTGNAQRFNYSIALGLDGTQQKLVEAVHAWMPGRGTYSANAFIGLDRLITQGLTETPESYAARLQRAFDTWRVAGNAWAVMQQVLGYLLSFTPPMRTVSTKYDADGVPEHSIWNYYNAGDDTKKPPKHTYEGTGEWNWDESSPTVGSWGWWRWYLVIEATDPNEWIGTLGEWGQSPPLTWGQSGAAWGVSRPAEVGQSIQRIVRLFKANWCHWIIVSFDGSEFRPGAGVLPDGNYGHWSKVTSRHHQRSRSTNARYCTCPI